ncbi:hypothetical protein M422DRAFT_86625, partial [Sphaerobolus stellatus SS14]
GYNVEEIAAFVYPTQICGAVPYYALFNATIGNHFYTVDANERSELINQGGYQDQGIVAYV